MRPRVRTDARSANAAAVALAIAFAFGGCAAAARAQAAAAQDTASAITSFADAEAALAGTARATGRRPGFVAWSPDHRRCAWVEDAPAGDSIEHGEEVHTEDADGGHAAVTRLARPVLDGLPPVWVGAGPLILHNPSGAQTVHDIEVVQVVDGTARTWLAQPDATGRSLAANAAGLVAIAFRREWNGTNGVIVCRADGATQAVVDLEQTLCHRAKPSPDGRSIALVFDDALAVVAVDGGRPRRLARLASDDNATAPPADPQWLADSQSFVVATGTEALHVHVEKGVLQRWGPTDLGGLGVAVVLLPGDTIAAALAVRRTDANALDFVLHIAEQQHSSYLDVVWLDLASGATQHSRTKNQWLAEGWQHLRRVGPFVAEHLR